MTMKLIHDRAPSYGPLIGLTGKSGAGKDTVAKFLIKKYGFVRFAFADTLKKVALDIDPVIPWWGRLSQMVLASGWDEAEKDPEVRRILQCLGTSIRDHIGIDTWSDIVMCQINNVQQPVVITDVRFPNEVTAIHSDRGIVVRIERQVGGLSSDPAAHRTEQALASAPADYTIHNDGTFDDLKVAVDHMMLL